MNLLYTPDDILMDFDAGALKRGSDYYLKNKVINISSSQEGDFIVGVVDGSRGNIYEVQISIAISHGINRNVEFYATCSCPVRRDCKHAVAVLYAHWFYQMDLFEGEEDIIESDTYPVFEAEENHSVVGKTDVESWLKNIEDKFSSASKVKKLKSEKISPNHLLYILNLVKQPAGEMLSVEYFSARKLKAGGYGKDNLYDPARIMSGERALFIRDEDEAILRDVYARKIMDYIEYFDLSDAGGGEILKKMLSTGRCHWQDKNTTPLSEGPMMKAEMQWKLYDDATQQLNFIVEDPSSIVLPTIPPFYINETSLSCGPLEIDVPQKAVELIQKSPKVPVDELSSVSKRLTKVIENIPKPAAVKIKYKKDITPIPCLHFGLTDDPQAKVYSFLDPIPTMEITLSYDGRKTSLFEKGIELSYMQGEELVKFKRNLVAEKEHLDLIESLDLIPLKRMYFNFHSLDLFVINNLDDLSEHELWVSFMVNELPLFTQRGWVVTYDEGFPYRLAEVDEWQMTVDEDDNNEWFEIDLGIVVDGERFNLANIMSVLIRQNPRVLNSKTTKKDFPMGKVIARLNEGVMLAIPFERVSRMLNVLFDLYGGLGRDKARVKLPKWRVAELTELQSQGLHWQGDQNLKASAEKLDKFKKIKPKAAPRSFKAKLRDYQKEGLAWLQFLREYDFHGVLADDMGLGKTVQALAHICVEKAANRLNKPVLVVAPTSLMYNWRHEAEQFAPHLKILTLQGLKRKEHFHSIAEHDVVLTTYPLLGRDDEVLLQQEWHMLILDEAQNIKNPKTKATKVACQLKAKHRLCLTGTPMENHLGELWSMFHFLMPGLLGNEKEFRQLFRNPIEKRGDTELGQKAAQRLAKRLAPFMLRRKKDDVVKELPMKTEIIRSVALDGVQRDLYETVRVSMQKKVRDSISDVGMGRSHIVVLDALLKLRQICCDPRLLKTKNLMSEVSKSKSAKFDLLMTLLPELLDEGRKILLFSQFTSMLSLIEEELKARKIKYVKLTGSTRNREKPIDAFQNGDAPVFLISLKAGGTGLNLTAADTVIHYDPWWNPAVESQATDRAHRIGQQKPVFVYKLLTDNTVEARIQVMQETKRKLAEGLFDGGGKGQLPDAKSLEALFEPLQ